MKLIPNELVTLFECWLSNCCTCVKWDNAKSQSFHISVGVRPGSVLSPCLFAIYLDDLTFRCLSVPGEAGSFVILYADDILLIAPSVCGLDNVMRICQLELDKLNMVINARKSCWLRIGARNNALCMPLSLTTGAIMPCVDEIRYLGIFIVRSRVLKCSLDHAKSLSTAQLMHFLQKSAA